MHINHSKLNAKELDKEINIWLEILHLWQNQLHFLKARILSRKSDLQNSLLNEGENSWISKIDFFGDSVLADYKESLTNHKGDLKEETTDAIDDAWLHEHHVYKRHMRQLKKEYSELKHEVFNSL